MKDVAQNHEAGGLLRTIATAWDRFWFQPANPMTWGLIRICAGLLTLYVHLAYCPDLFEFFGEDGWKSLALANEQRKESPWVGPSTRWVGMVPSLYLPADEEDRSRILDFFQENMDDGQKYGLMLSYLRRPENAPEGTLPGWLRSLPDVPNNVSTTPQDWEPPPQPSRAKVIEFLEGLPKDKAERDRVLTYMKKHAFDPRQLFWQGNFHWSVWYHVTDPTWMVVTHTAVLVVIFLFTIGFCTRITSVLSWLAALSYIQRSPITLFGSDTMMNVLLFYLMIAPSGAALSVDRLLARWWQVRQARRRGLPIPAWQGPQPMVSANFAQRMLMIHFCIIYFAAGTSKLLGGNWWNGTAIYYTMANYEFSPLNTSNYRGMLRWMCQNRLLWELHMTLGSYFTLALEIGFPFLVWNRRLRPFMVAASMLLHVAIAVFLGLTIFSLLMATMVISFIPGEAVERLLGRFRRFLPGGPDDSLPAPRPETPPEGDAADEEPAATAETNEAAPESVTAHKPKGWKKKGKKNSANYENSLPDKS